MKRNKGYQYQVLLCTVCLVLHMGSSLQETVLATTAKEFFAMGVTAFKQGSYEEALKYFRESANLDPDKPRTHYNLGVLYKKLGRLNDALKEFDVAASLSQLAPVTNNFSPVNEFVRVGPTVKLDEDNFEVITPDTSVLTPSNNDRESEILKQASTGTVQTSSPPQQQTTVAQPQPQKLKVIPQQQKNSGAVTKTIKPTPLKEDVQSLTAEAYGYYLSKDYDQAIRTYKKILSMTPHNDNVLKELGDVYYDTQDYENALSYYSKITGTSNTSLLKERLGELNLKLGHTQEAIRHYQLIVKSDMGNLNAAYKLAQAYETQKEYKNAALMYQQIADIDPYYNNVKSDLARMQIATGSTQDALVTYQEAVATDPLDFQAQYNLGKLNLKSGKYQEAINNLTKALEINASLYEAKSDLAEAYYKLAEQYNASSNNTTALEYYHDALKYNPNHLGALYASAQNEIRNGQLTQAINKLELVLQNNTNNKDVAYILGNLYLKNHNNQKAIDCFNKVLTIDSHYKDIPDKLVALLYKVEKYTQIIALATGAQSSTLSLNPHSKYLLAQSYYQQGNIQKANTILADINLQTLSGKDKSLLQGLIKYKMGQYDEALQSLESLSIPEENQEEVYQALADIYDKKGMREKAVIYIEKLVVQNPENVTLLEKLGHYSLQENMYDKALSAFETLVKVSPQSNHNKELSMIYLQLGAKEYAAGNFQKAIESLNQSLSLSFSKEGYLYLAKAYSQQNNSLKAIESLKMYGDLDPSNTEALYMIAKEYQKDKDFDNALEYLSKVNLLMPNYPHITQDFIELYSLAALEDLEQNNFSGAREKIEKAILYDMKNPELYNNLGYIYHREGKNLKALENYEMALQLDIKYKEANYNLARLYLENKDYNKAVKYLKDVLAVAPDDLNANTDLANLYFKSGRYGTAENYYEKVVATNPKSYPALYNLGIIAAKKMQYKESLTYFRQLSGLYPNDADIKNNLEFLYKKLQIVTSNRSA